MVSAVRKKSRDPTWSFKLPTKLSGFGPVAAGRPVRFGVARTVMTGSLRLSQWLRNVLFVKPSSQLNSLPWRGMSDLTEFAFAEAIANKQNT